MSNDVWFLGDNSNGSGAKGFTDNVSNALRDRHGAPILAGGTYRRLVSVVVGRMEAVQKKKLDVMWEQLFDVNDKLTEQTDRLSAYAQQSEVPESLLREIQFTAGLRRGMVQMISVQQLGNAEPSAIDMIETELREAYEDDEPEQAAGEPVAATLRIAGEAGGGDQRVLQEGARAGGEAVGTG